jgi:phosphopantothenoylcysteine decarboxylase/phosphopantothenate--cysteine ligase
MEKLAQKSVLLVIGGGIAAYKCLELIRLLKKSGIGVRVIMTKAAQHFVTPLSVASLSGEKVFDDLFSLTDETEMGHIELSRSADLLVVAPATADLMAKMAHGFAGDLAATALLATDKPVLIAPAMNVRMWLHAATQRNLATLKADGIHVVGPDEGDMACGEYGPGRMAEPAEILGSIQRLLLPTARPLRGKSVLITAGPTREPIDPVRFISNHSSGKQGYALAQQAAAMGANVTLISGPVELAAPLDVKLIKVETAREMLAAAIATPKIDLAICAAAVADWRVENPAKHKLKKEQSASPPQLQFSANPDILKTLSEAGPKRPAVVVGFAAETENVIENAKLKLKTKGCDLIVANDVSEGSGVFGGDRNLVHLVSAAGVEDLPELSKSDAAARILDAAVKLLSSRG